MGATYPKRAGVGVGLACAVLLANACRERAPSRGGSNSDSGTAVARYNGGAVTKEELARELGRLPPALRQQFETPAGHREMAHAMIDKRLLVAEARRRGFDADPETRRQVAELEERLVVQSLLSAEEKAAPPVTEAQARAFYDAHKKDFEQPERVRVARALAAVPAGAPATARELARGRAEKWAQRLRRGEPFAKVAAEGDGAERARAGDLGFLVLGEGDDTDLVKAAFSLKEVGKPSAVLALRDGFAVLQLAERHERRIPSFEEVRGEVEGRVAPAHKRKVFEDVLARLRSTANIQDVQPR